MRKKLLSALAATFILSATSPTFAMEIDENFTLDIEARYEYFKEKGYSDTNRIEARILPTYIINDTYSIKARFTGFHDFDPSYTSGRMNFLYGQGDFDQFTVKAGKIDYWDRVGATPINYSMIMDTELKGVVFETNLEDSRFQYLASISKNTIGFDEEVEGTYISAEALYTDEEEVIDAGVAYHYFKKDDFKNNILAIGGGYKLDEDSSLHATLAHNTEAHSNKTAYNIEYDYKNSDPQEANTWGAYAAYRYLGAGSLKPSYDSASLGCKGFEIGGVWTPIINTEFKLAYFHGKILDGGDSTHSLYARASWFF